MTWGSFPGRVIFLVEKTSPKITRKRHLNFFRGEKGAKFTRVLQPSGFIADGLNVHVRDVDGSTPLMLAAQQVRSSDFDISDPLTLVICSRGWTFYAVIWWFFKPLYKDPYEPIGISFCSCHYCEMNVALEVVFFSWSRALGNGGELWWGNWAMEWQKFVFQKGLKLQVWNTPVWNPKKHGIFSVSSHPGFLPAAATGCHQLTDSPQSCSDWFHYCSWANVPQPVHLRKPHELGTFLATWLSNMHGWFPHWWLTTADGSQKWWNLSNKKKKTH